MFLKHFRGDDICVPRTTQPYIAAAVLQEVSMFEDSFSEGHLYWGRVIAILAVATTFAYLVSQI